MEPLVCAGNRDAWRAWLQQHHASAEEAWLVYYKKHTGKPSVSYRDSVEEAICFGWIDGIKRRIDEERYTHRFTPRRQGSKWSPLNIRLAEQMIDEGKMMPAGLAAFDRRKYYDPELLGARQSNHAVLPPAIEKALRANPAAWKNFNELAPGYRKQYIGWLVGAVRPETRRKRTAEAVKCLEQNLKLGMK
jgi:uncharacterized protein YdeI (YjbR/CyaY-like superfamily)